MHNKHYYIIVRDYACVLSKTIADTIHAEEPESRFHFITMHAYVQDYFQDLSYSQIQVHYMPALLEDRAYDDAQTKAIDLFLRNKYGYGINRLYDIERFKPKENAEDFITRHVDVLFSIMKEPGVLLSLTMDHYIFILAGMVNDFRGGNNIYIQPIGFPLNAYILMKNPWLPIPVYSREKNAQLLEDYKKTLSMHPKDSVWYMKMDEFSAQILDRAKNKVERVLETGKLKKLKKKFTSYSYLDYLYIVHNNLHLSEETGVYIPKRETTLNEIREKYHGKVKLFFYPLHLEPEMSILAYSPFFQNQLELIQLTAKSLKHGDLLIIKENPKSQYRGDAFYSVIDALPNVIWIGKDENSREMIRLSDKVIGISGTASMEAACLGIETMVVGFPPFHKMLAQKPLSFYPHIDVAEALYEVHSKEEISDVLHANWPEYSQSIVQMDLRPVAVNSNLRSGEITDPEHKAKEIIEKIIRPCVDFWAQ